MKVLKSLFLFLALIGSSNLFAAKNSNLEMLEGDWTKAKFCEYTNTLGGLHWIESYVYFNFENNTYAVSDIVYGDKNCKHELYKLDFHHDVTVDEDSQKDNSGRLEATVSKYTITPLSTNGAIQLNLASACGHILSWSKGHSLEVTGHYCFGGRLNNKGDCFDIYYDVSDDCQTACISIYRDGICIQEIDLNRRDEETHEA